MKKEARLLLSKAIDALTLSVELFNRPHDAGRVEAVLIHLDHSFEMLLKASIIHKGGRIVRPGDKHTIGFEECVGKTLSDAQVKCLSEEQAALLRWINAHRDAAYHHLLEISEPLLYFDAQAGLTLFRDLLHVVFGQKLQIHFSRRVLPLSTTPPTDLVALFDSDVAEVRKLLKPGTRRRTEALARLRSLAIVDSALRGEANPPGTPELRTIGESIAKGGQWDRVFAGVATVAVTSDGTGPSLALRVTKKEGVPVRLVDADAPGATVVGVRRVNELGFYNLGRNDLARHLGLSGPKTTALIWHLDLQSHDDYFKDIRIGKTSHKRYSQSALSRLREAIESESIDEIWTRYRQRRAPGPGPGTGF